MSMSPTSFRPPRTYAEWRECIEIRCGIPLTRDYCRRRRDALADRGDPHTARFAELYGDEYLERVREWFRQAHDEPETAA